MWSQCWQPLVEGVTTLDAWSAPQGPQNWTPSLSLSTQLTGLWVLSIVGQIKPIQDGLPSSSCSRHSWCYKWEFLYLHPHHSVSIKKLVNWERMWALERRKLNSFGFKSGTEFEQIWHRKFQIPFFLSLNNLPCLPSFPPAPSLHKPISHGGELMASGRRSDGNLTDRQVRRGHTGCIWRYHVGVSRWWIRLYSQAQPPPVLAIVLPNVKGPSRQGLQTF